MPEQPIGSSESSVPGRFEAVREVLLSQWDPHDVMRRVELWGDAARMRYDRYVTDLLALADADADVSAVAAYLKEREAESMCFPGSASGADARLQRVAGQILQAARAARPARGH